MQNLAAAGLNISYSFLGEPAGYDINQRLIEYNSQSTHWRASVVGVLNTLLVAFLGCLMATIFGVFAGILRLSNNWIVAKIMAVYVEIFPRQSDFAIRTFGMPGGAGFLGVCFGHLITANSPATQTENPTNWKSVLWHEFCHAVTLGKTNNRMPRWLSEGISVYEERQRSPNSGEQMSPVYRKMILSSDLTPVSNLSAAFLQAKSPIHLQFAYYESSLVIEYLMEKHGIDTLKKILVDLGAGIPINETLQRHFRLLVELRGEALAINSVKKALRDSGRACARGRASDGG